jgi:hypothetical protein
MSSEEAAASETPGDGPVTGREDKGGEPDGGASGGMSDWMSALRDMAPYLDLGWRLAVSVAAPPILGHLLVDHFWATTPWGVLIGAGIGIAGGIVQLRRLQVELDR